MLIDVEVHQGMVESNYLPRLVIGGSKGAPKRLHRGVYQVKHFSFDKEIKHPGIFSEWPNFGLEFFCYGVCDSPEQLMGVLPIEVTESDRKFVVGVTKISKANQPLRDGWRWRKWGPYVGEQEPQRSYLHDEPDIKEVWCYHILELEST